MSESPLHDEQLARLAAAREAKALLTGGPLGNIVPDAGDVIAMADWILDRRDPAPESIWCDECGASHSIVKLDEGMRRLLADLFADQKAERFRREDDGR